MNRVFGIVGGRDGDLSLNNDCSTSREVPCSEIFLWDSSFEI